MSVSSLDSAVEAITALRQEKAGSITVYTPTPRHELEHAMAHGPSVVRRFTLIGGLLGVTFGYWIAIWVSEYWPLVVGGKPIPSWVPYTIIGFEVMVLFGSLATVFGMFAVARVPKLMMTVGYDPRFSAGDYGIWVECPPDRETKVTEVLRANGAVEVRRER